MTVIYTAIVLDNNSQNKIRKLATHDDWKIISHHVTLISPPLQRSGVKIDADLIGSHVAMKAIAIARNNKVSAIEIEIPCNIQALIQIPKIPHVTIEVNQAENAKPVMSNDFINSDFKEIEPINISGIIQEYTKTAGVLKWI